MKVRNLTENTDWKGKKVLLRVDFNVPVKNGVLKDDSRIVQTLPTIKYLLEQGAKLILVSHLGRPDGKVVEELRMAPVSMRLAELLKQKVVQLDEVVGENVKKAVNEMLDGDMIFLENVRFKAGEEKNDPAFAKELADLAEVFVSDSFATAHRAHASTVGVSDYLPSYAGMLMEKEINHLSKLLDQKNGSLTLVVGGAKIDTKIGLIENFIGKADYFLIGGGLANTFLAAEGFDVGASLCELNKIETAQKIMLAAEFMNENFVLPEDVVVADEPAEGVTTLDIPVEDVEGDMKILDIGKRSIQKFVDIIHKSKTVVWNGPVGLSEIKAFSAGTEAIAKALTDKNVCSILGGGDTIEAFRRLGFKEEQFTFVSTGGGAMLEFLEGTPLPGVEILLVK